MRAVNLLPLDARYQQEMVGCRRHPRVTETNVGLGAITAGVLVLSIGAAFLLARSTVNDRRETLAEVTQRTLVAEANAAHIRAEQDSAQARLAAFTDAESRRTGWEKVLRDLSRVLPGHAFLQSLSVTSPTPAAAPRHP